MNFIPSLINGACSLLWGDLITIPLPGGNSIGLSLLVLLLIPTGIYFTIRTRFLPVRLFPEMLRVAMEKRDSGKRGSISGVQALVVSTATRVGMGNLVGVVAAVSAGGAGAVFWMWVTALLGSATSFVESTLAQLHREEDPLYGGWRGGPAHYIHRFAEKKRGKKLRFSVIAVLFALSGLICWCGISQVISYSVTSAMDNAFHVSPPVTAIALVAVSAVIVLRKNATVRVLDVLVPAMAGCFFIITVILILMNIQLLPSIFRRIFEEAFGLRQAVAGGFGTVLMNGVKRGLFSNEAGSGSAPCAAAAGDTSHPAKTGLLQALGVFIDTLVICSCTAFVILMTPEDITSGLVDMDLFQAAMDYHLGRFGVVFIAITLVLFCLSTFIGILFYARPNISYLFGDNWASQTVYKIVALVMLFMGGLSASTTVWTLGDVGVGLMTVFNILVILPMGGEALAGLRDYERLMKARKTAREQTK